jgi:hypothetical protein
MPFGHQQGSAKGDIQGQGMLGTLGCLWQGREQLDPAGEVVDGFQMGRAVAGVLASPLPVPHGRRGETSLGVVVRQQLGLRRSRLWKLRFQYLGNALVGTGSV